MGKFFSLSFCTFLQTDTTTRLPTVVPIVTSLFDDRSWGRQLLGRAVCHYDRLRGKLKVSLRIFMCHIVNSSRTTRDAYGHVQ